MLKSYFFADILLILLSAIIIALGFFSLSFPKIPFALIIPFALAPLFIALRRLPLNTRSTWQVCKSATIYLWLFGLMLQLIAFFWITKPLIYFGGIHPLSAYFLFLIISALSAFYFPLLFSPIILNLCYNAKRISIDHIYKNTYFIFSVTLACTLLEIYLPRFFDWSFGTLLSSNLILSQLASICGFNTGSLFIFYISLSMSDINKLNKFKTMRNIIIIIILAAVFGYVHLYNLQNKLSNKIRLGFIQPNFTYNDIASIALPSREQHAQSLQTMLQLSEQLIQKSIDFDGNKLDLLIWPESTAPDFFFFNQNQIAQVTALSKKSSVPFLIQTTVAKAEDLPRYSWLQMPLLSASLIINSAGLQRPYFAKWVPMPFGEELPFEHYFPMLGIWYRSIFKNASKILRGTDYKALAVNKDIYVTPLICFDAIKQKLGYLSSRFGKANMLVNQANFVWMVDSNAGLELALLDKMRAIENARSILLVANNGPSMAFDPSGKLIFQPTELFRQTINFIDLPLYSGQTIFHKIYYWPLVGLGSVSFCYLIIKYLLVLKQGKLYAMRDRSNSYKSKSNS